MRQARVNSLAKINLDLRVLNKREDNFHELRTVFQTISLADVIKIEYEPARKTELTLAGNVEIPDNLVIRAARAALDTMKVKAYVHFHLSKRIPMGAGLGGGSSNAAAVLLALPVLAGKSLAPEELHEIGAALGSDVPFFLLGGTAIALGRGTEMYPIADVAKDPILVVSAGLHVSTPEAYKALNRNLTFAGSSTSINNFQGFVRTLAETGSARLASARSSNDFAAVVFRQYPQLKSIKGRLRKLGAAAQMTGSGSSIFGIFESSVERERALDELKSWKGIQNGEVFRAELVSGRRYREMWRRQLAPHLDLSIDSREVRWPPRSRYAR